jgi:archaemetzincin
MNILVPEATNRCLLHLRMKPLLAALLALLSATCAFAAEALPAPAAPAAPVAPLRKIAIQPLGKVSADVLAEARKSIEGLYEVEVVVLPAKELPESAFYKPRQRYRAEKLLDWLHANTDAAYTKIVGLTQSDISTTKGEFEDWGIFGLGALGERPCVVSTFRLTRNVTRAKMLDRVGKVVGHEVGHTFGLEHCPTPGCLMGDAEGKVSTVDNEPGQFCEACRKRVPAKGR